MNSACRRRPKKPRPLPCSPMEPGAVGRRMCRRPPGPGGRPSWGRYPMPEKKTCVALLRGINVGGNRRVAMADLRGWAEEIGLQQVRTYVQSGNLVFKSQQPAAALEKKIERKIAQAARSEERRVGKEWRSRRAGKQKSR